MRAIATKPVKKFPLRRAFVLLFNFVQHFINYMRTIVTEAVKKLRLRRAKMCMHTYMHCNVHTPRWGGIYTTTPEQLRNDTPLGGYTGKK